MLQHVTIKTEDRKILKPIIESAIENEKKMLLLGLQQTRTRLEEFESKYKISSTQFERQLHASEVEETVEFSDWRMEIGMLRLLERQYKALQDAKLD